MYQHKPNNKSNENVSQTTRLHLDNDYSKINNQLETGCFCDIILVAGLDEFKMKAHKSILCASSEYFKVKLSGTSKDSKYEEITLNEIDGKLLSLIVRCCYDGCAIVTKENIADVLRIVDQYGMESLLHECYHILERLIDNDNCIEVFQSADSCQLTDFSKYIIVYIQHNFQMLKDTESFCNLNFDEIMKILRSDCLKVNSEEDIFDGLSNWLQKDFDNRKVYLPQLLSLIHMIELKPEFIEKHIQPLFENSRNLKVDAMIIKSLIRQSTLNNEDHKPIKCPNLRKSNDHLLIVSILNESYKFYCYTKHSNDLKFLKSLPIEDVRHFGAVHDKDLIVLNDKDQLGRLMLEEDKYVKLFYTYDGYEYDEKCLLVWEDDLYHTIKRNTVILEVTFFKYNITSGKLTDLTSNFPSNTIQIVYFNQHIYFLVGNNNVCNSIWRFDESTEELNEIKLTAEFEIISKPVEYNNRMYALRRSENDVTSMIRFSTQFDSWSQISDLPEGLSEIDLINFNNSLTVIGKRDQNYSLFHYIPHLNYWILLNNLNFEGKLNWIATASPEFFKKIKQ